MEFLALAEHPDEDQTSDTESEQGAYTNERSDSNHDQNHPLMKRKLELAKNPAWKKRKITREGGKKWTCIFCSQTMPLEDQKAHMNSLAHAKKKREHLTEEANGGSYRCDLCDRWIKTKNREAHEKSKKHLKKVKRTQRSKLPLEGPPGLNQKVVPAPMPPGWTAHIHPEMKRSFYFHAMSNHTTWNHPLSQEYAQEYARMMAGANGNKSPDKTKKRKHSRGKNRNNNQQTFYCDICNRKMMYNSMMEHLSGKSHLRKKKNMEKRANYLMGKLKKQLDNGTQTKVMIAREPRRLPPPL